MPDGIDVYDRETLPTTVLRPTSNQSRIARGFHRIGIVAALPPLLLGIGIACQETWLGWNAPALPNPPRANGNLTYEEFTAHQAYYGYAIAWCCLALALYIAARAIGWVLDGFASPS